MTMKCEDCFTTCNVKLMHGISFPHKWIVFLYLMIVLFFSCVCCVHDLNLVVERLSADLCKVVLTHVRTLNLCVGQQYASSSPTLKVFAALCIFVRVHLCLKTSIFMGHYFSSVWLNNSCVTLQWLSTLLFRPYILWYLSGYLCHFTGSPEIPGSNFW